MSEKSLDVEGMCRTCMSNRLTTCRGPTAKKLRRSIYEKPNGWTEGPTIMELLRSVQPAIQIDAKDKLPKIMCHDCIEQLQMSYEFLQMYKDTDVKFRKMLKDNDPTNDKLDVYMIDADATAFVEVKIEHIVQDVDNNSIINGETDNVEDNVNYDAPGMPRPQVGGNSPTLKFEIEMEANGSSDDKPFDNASDSDNGDCTSKETSKRNLDKDFNKLLMPLNEDGSITCHECNQVQRNVTLWQKHMLGHNSTREQNKIRRKDISNRLEYEYFGKGAANSIASPTESEFCSDLDATNLNCSLQNSTYLQTDFFLDKTMPILRPLSSEFSNFGQDTILPNQPEKLPSTEDIKKICEFQDGLKRQTLENKHRTKLAKALISYIQKSTPDRKLLREEFLQLAQSIVEIFPSEVKETYYVPFTNGHLAKGKLFDAYNNNRTRLRAAGLIRRRGRTKSKENHSSVNSISSVKGFESGSDLEASFSKPEPCSFRKTELPIVQTVSFDGDNCSQHEMLFSQQQLPSTQDIRQIVEFRNVLNVRTLENKHRTRLAKALISCIQEKSPDRKLTREDFLQLAQSIVDIFPSELNATYYVPFRKGRLARGKLFDAYNNARSRLKAAGLIRRRVKRKSE